MSRALDVFVIPVFLSESLSKGYVFQGPVSRAAIAHADHFSLLRQFSSGIDEFVVIFNKKCVLY